MNQKDLGKSPLYQALVDLDKRIDEDMELKVVGGFAMIAHGFRDVESMTDIDYVGPQLPPEVKQAAKDLESKYGLPSDWLNNDLLLSGTTLEELEFSTGPLHFTESFQLEHIKVSLLDTEDLLRMKVIAIDTNCSAFDFSPDNEFTRKKDFRDIDLLIKELHKDPKQLEKEYSDYLLSDATIPCISAYMEKGIDAAMEVVEGVKKQSMARYLLEAVAESSGATEKTIRETNPIIDQFLNFAIEKNEQQKREPKNNNNKDWAL